MSTSKKVRCIRVLEYVGEEEWVRQTLERSIGSPNSLALRTFGQYVLDPKRVVVPQRGSIEEVTRVGPIPAEAFGEPWNGVLQRWRGSNKPVNLDWLDEQEFYELMQAYRHVLLGDQKEAQQKFELVKEFIRRKVTRDG